MEELVIIRAVCKSSVLLHFSLIPFWMKKLFHDKKYQGNLCMHRNKCLLTWCPLFFLCIPKWWTQGTWERYDSRCLETFQTILTQATFLDIFPRSIPIRIFSILHSFNLDKFHPCQLKIFLGEFLKVGVYLGGNFSQGVIWLHDSLLIHFL